MKMTISGGFKRQWFMICYSVYGFLPVMALDESLGRKNRMAEVRVSVIVPVYNAEDTIRECLDGITGQTLRETEIICVDDGSSDGSVDILEEYRRKDSRIRIVRQENQGAGAARNTGMKEARGDYLCFLDADDRFEPEMLRAAWERCRGTSAEICVWAADGFDAETGNIEAYTSAFDRNYILKTNPFDPASDEAHETILQMFNGVPWNKLFSRELVDRTGLQFQTLRTTNDAFFVYSALCRARLIVTLDRVLVHRRKNGAGSLTQTREKSWRCFFEALTAIRERLEQDGLFERFERSYMNRALQNVLWNMETISLSGAKQMESFLKEEGFERLKFDQYGAGFYYEHLYERYQWLREMDPAAFRTVVKIGRERDALAAEADLLRNRLSCRLADRAATILRSLRPGKRG